MDVLLAGVGGVLELGYVAIVLQYAGFMCIAAIIGFLWVTHRVKANKVPLTENSFQALYWVNRRGVFFVIILLSIFSFLNATVIFCSGEGSEFHKNLSAHPAVLLGSTVIVLLMVMFMRGQGFALPLGGGVSLGVDATALQDGKPVKRVMSFHLSCDFKKHRSFVLGKVQKAVSDIQGGGPGFEVVLKSWFLASKHGMDDDLVRQLRQHMRGTRSAALSIAAALASLFVAMVIYELVNTVAVEQCVEWQCVSYADFIVKACGCVTLIGMLDVLSEVFSARRKMKEIISSYQKSPSLVNNRTAFTNGNCGVVARRVQGTSAVQYRFLDPEPMSLRNFLSISVLMPNVMNTCVGAEAGVIFSR
ncbi:MULTISPECIES: hypothetical protein [Pseudomonas]|uniref:Uncharacterized protein n=1 Tax=Pseudomonas fluorescens TaxID=294 RepID=A0A5E6SSX1_PSEFL|nr:MULTISPECIES: hypothetical protein [Pseudomonas]VVM83630.1 hypothetical protein PS652_02418 [Pseudomonas fluorescens]